MTQSVREMFQRAGRPLRRARAGDPLGTVRVRLRVKDRARRRIYSSNFLKTRQAFWPPKPKLFFSTTFTSPTLRALLGT